MLLLGTTCLSECQQRDLQWLDGSLANLKKGFGG